MTTYAPRHVDIWPWTQVYGSSAGITRANNSLAIGLGYMYPNDYASINNWVSWMVAVDAGTWTLTDIYIRDTTSGIVTWSLGGTSLGTLDLYGGAQWNAVKQIVGFTVATAGVYELKAQVLSKNASASSYAQTRHLVTLTRTGA